VTVDGCLPGLRQRGGVELLGKSPALIGGSHVISVVVGCCRSASFAGSHPWIPHGDAPANKGQRYPADPPTVDEIVAVTLASVDDRNLSSGHRQRGDHLHRPRPARSDDARQRRARPIANRGSAQALPPRPETNPPQAAAGSHRCWSIEGGGDPTGGLAVALCRSERRAASFEQVAAGSAEQRSGGGAGACPDSHRGSYPVTAKARPRASRTHRRSSSRWWWPPRFRR
jgi:hypothetical protein